MNTSYTSQFLKAYFRRYFEEIEFERTLIEIIEIRLSN